MGSGEKPDGILSRERDRATMADGLFQGLPPPATPQIIRQQEDLVSKATAHEIRQSSAVADRPLKSAIKPPTSPRSNACSDKESAVIPAPALKSAIKRCTSPESRRQDSPEPTVSAPALKSAMKRSKLLESRPQATVPEKRCRFKTVADASAVQILDAMQKISAHIKCPGKFSKASKLAVQLIEAGSVDSGTSDPFFAILEAAMSSPISCSDASVRADFHTLFLAAQELLEYFNYKQRNLLATWTLRAVVANDLFTDDSFVFSKAAARIREAIISLPIATEDDDEEEALALKDEAKSKEDDGKNSWSGSIKSEESDPFGLDALIPSTLKKDEKMKDKEEDEECKRFVQSQREALVACLEIAARRYKIPWCQTGIDILAKHAYDNMSRFTQVQRVAIKKLWNSIREQQIWRKQGKSVTGKLDMNGFEWLQQKYAAEKISIRHSVGGSCRRAEQWLG